VVPFKRKVYEQMLTKFSKFAQPDIQVSAPQRERSEYHMKS
jgi:hypothetical protein